MHLPNRLGKLPHRREFMRIGGLFLGGLGFSQNISAQSHRDSAGKSVIMLYMHGGPSHLETYDLKPDAPVEYRSVFKPIATNVPGIRICEHLPLHSRIADKFSIVRSCHHTMSSHSDGGIEVLTGKTPTRPDPASTSVSEHPDFGSIVSKMRGLREDGVPNFVAIPQKPYMTRPSYLGLQFGPLASNDPSVSWYTPPSLKIAGGLSRGLVNDRRELLKQFDGMKQSAENAGLNRFHPTAFRMIDSPQIASAFDLNGESDRLRDRYGRNTWGQGFLLARRLAEAGVSAITVFVDTPKQGQEFTNWDDHILNAMRPGHFAQYMKLRLQYYDQAVSALIEDIFNRDKQDDILVVAMGEFGRTPRLSSNSSGTGRDHWPDAQSVLLSGGGLKMGQVVGATNAKGEYPSQRPLTPKDVLATIYSHLEIDFSHQFIDPSGRPVAILSEGEPIRELV